MILEFSTGKESPPLFVPEPPTKKTPATARIIMVRIIREVLFIQDYKLNNGLIIPRPARPDINANSPNPSTTTPADLKKRGAYLEWAKEAEPNESKESIG